MNAMAPHIRSVFRNSTVESRYPNNKGISRNPFLIKDHSSRQMVVELHSNVASSTWRMVCMIARCQTCVPRNDTEIALV